jgi:hypothetical protein
MREAKLRLGWIKAVATGEFVLDPVIGYELCALNTRLVIEIIALGALTVHGDIPAAKRLSRDEWSPDKIMNGLEALHPEFYPIPYVLKAMGPGRWYFDFLERPSLTKSELLTMYGQTNDALHKGKLKNILSGQKTLKSDLEEALHRHDELRTLLCVHRVPLLTPVTTFVCILDNAGDEVQVFMGFGDSLEPIGSYSETFKTVGS